MQEAQDQRICSVLLPSLLLLLLLAVSFVAGNTHSLQPSGNVNGSLPQPVKLSRAKRVAIFNGQGVVKFVASVAHPVKLPNKNHNFWFFYNLQNQYVPTTIPIYWWSFWNTTTFVSTARELRKDLQATLHRDETRSWLYDAIEIGMQQVAGSELGAVCLLRGICEISQLPFENSNVFSEMLNALLIPTVHNVAEKYLNARDAGRAGADCLRTYKDCSPKVWSWLAHVTKMTF
ncbi:CG17784 [Drosophila busckii]|uniref:CG17784 n=1 Tax=Drosophila busckii TaxID=30019 RepID=A0A0M4ENQ5_DROBS|nr:uncharacterized protein LOC108601517 [Drosophila busckii]ALC47290.1 CG17784 [Drosophila busckii]